MVEVVGAIVGATIGDNHKRPLSVTILTCIFIEYDCIMYRTIIGRRKEQFIALKPLPRSLEEKNNANVSRHIVKVLEGINYFFPLPRE